MVEIVSKWAEPVVIAIDLVGAQVPPEANEIGEETTMGILLEMAEMVDLETVNGEDTCRGMEEVVKVGEEEVEE